VDNNGLRQSRNSFGTESGTVSDEIAPEGDPVTDLAEPLKRLGPAERERLRLRLGNLQDQRREAAEPPMGRSRSHRIFSPRRISGFRRRECPDSP